MDEMTSTGIGSAIVSVILSLVSGVILYRSNRQAERMEEFAKSISTLESTAVSDSHVRQVIREEMQQLTVLLPRLMDSMQKVELYIADEKGYKAAQNLMRMNNT